MRKLLFITAIAASFSTQALAQQDVVTTTTAPAPMRAHNKIYSSSSLDGALFSINTGSNAGITNVVRFSYFINTGMNFNYDFNNHIGVYAGIGVKNLGFIEKGKSVAGTTFHDITVKHRVYAAGIPVGIKIGKLSGKGTFAILGGGADFPINYKEKTFTDGRKNKTKMNEWFSDRTEHVLPYVFAGVSIKGGLTVKFQYYLSDFMDQDYTVSGVKPYSGMDTHLALLSLSFNVKGKNDGSFRSSMKAMMHKKK